MSQKFSSRIKSGVWLKNHRFGVRWDFGFLLVPHTLSSGLGKRNLLLQRKTVGTLYENNHLVGGYLTPHAILRIWRSCSSLAEKRNHTDGLSRKMTHRFSLVWVQADFPALKVTTLSRHCCSCSCNLQMRTNVVSAIDFPNVQQIYNYNQLT